MIIVLAALCGAVPFAAPAQAQQINAPPGLSGVDEYLETVPGASGAERPGGGSGAGGGPAPGEVEAKTDAALPAETVRELRRAGKDGEQVARLAATNAPVDPASGPADAAAVRGAALTDDGSSSAAGAISAVLSGATGAGAIFPISLLALTLALVAAAVRRRQLS